MKKIAILLLLCMNSIISCSNEEFDVFSSKFPQLSLPIASDKSSDFSDSFYYHIQFDKESSITEQEFVKYIKTSRWGEFQQPTDSLLHIYHYVPVGRLDYKSYVILFVNCGYMPLPNDYDGLDIGTYENLLCVYTRDGKRTDSIVFSGHGCISNQDGKFAPNWHADMPLTFEEGSFTDDGTIVIQHFKDNERTPYSIDTLQIDERSGKIIKQ